MKNKLTYQTLCGFKTIKFNNIEKVVNKFNEWHLFTEKNAVVTNIEEFKNAVDPEKVIIKYIGKIED